MTDAAFASFGQGGAAYATTTGFSHGWRKSFFSYGASVIAEKDGAMERDYAATSARRPDDLRDEYDIGTEAGERTARRVGPQKIESGVLPVVFDRRVASTFLSALSGAISGPAVARGVSFLREKLGEQVLRTASRSLMTRDGPGGMPPARSTARARATPNARSSKMAG